MALASGFTSNLDGMAPLYRQQFLILILVDVKEVKEMKFYVFKMPRFISYILKGLLGKR
jgi:hypothetical protein